MDSMLLQLEDLMLLVLLVIFQMLLNVLAPPLLPSVNQDIIILMEHVLLVHQMHSHVMEELLANVIVDSS